MKNLNVRWFYISYITIIINLPDNLQAVVRWKWQFCCPWLRCASQPSNMWAEKWKIFRLEFSANEGVGKTGTLLWKCAFLACLRWPAKLRCGFNVSDHRVVGKTVEWHQNIMSYNFPVKSMLECNVLLIFFKTNLLFFQYVGFDSYMIDGFSCFIWNIGF